MSKIKTRAALPKESESFKYKRKRRAGETAKARRVASRCGRKRKQKRIRRQRCGIAARRHDLFYKDLTQGAQNANAVSAFWARNSRIASNLNAKLRTHSRKESSQRHWVSGFSMEFFASVTNNRRSFPCSASRCSRHWFRIGSGSNPIAAETKRTRLSAKL